MSEKKKRFSSHQKCPIVTFTQKFLRKKKITGNAFDLYRDAGTATDTEGMKINYTHQLKEGYGKNFVSAGTDCGVKRSFL